MPFDFPPDNSVLDARRAQGSVGYQKGVSAEDQVARYYTSRGFDFLHQRWRGRGGEIDLIFSQGDEIIFVEVKASRDHARALERLSRRQVSRLCASAEEFLGQCPKGSLTPMRLDVALLDAQGRIEILENALLTL
jgi:putative endonuclease